MSEEEDYIEGVEKEILMGHCLGCSHAYPLEDMNEQGLCEECEEDEEEVCDHEWEVDRVTDWGMNGGNIVHVCVDIYCPKCETYGNTDGSWEFTDDEVL